MSNFKVWIDSPDTENVLSTTAFSNDSQRRTGFKSGRAASAIRMNTALRQANLIAVALVDALGISTSYDVKSSVENITNWFKNTSLFKLTTALNYNNTVLQVKKSIVPTSTSYDIGSSSAMWNTIYAQTGKFTDIDAIDVDCTTVTASDKFIGDLEGIADKVKVNAVESDLYSSPVWFSSKNANELSQDSSFKYFPQTKELDVQRVMTQRITTIRNSSLIKSVANGASNTFKASELSNVAPTYYDNILFAVFKVSQSTTTLVGMFASICYQNVYTPSQTIDNVTMTRDSLHDWTITFTNSSGSNIVVMPVTSILYIL